MTKYRNQPVIVDGIYYASKKEFSRWCELQAAERAGLISKLERQKSYPLRVNGILITTYRADASYLDKDGREQVEDSKGQRSGAAYAMFQLKAKLMIAVYGLRVIEI